MGSASPPDYSAAADEPSPDSGMEKSSPVSDEKKPSAVPAAREKPSTDSAVGEEPSAYKSRQVTKFEDRYGRVIPYCDTFFLEVDPNCDPSLECDTDSEDEDFAKSIKGATASIPTLVKYVNQIRESFGFDVDCYTPNWFQGSFYPIDMAWAKIEKEWFYEKINKIADFAIDEINADLVYDGKSSIELVKLEKVVLDVPCMDLLTLRVETKERDQTKIGAEDDGMNAQTIQAIIYEGHGNEPPLSLEQWRFKPAEPDFWYKAPPLPQRKRQRDERDDV